MAATDVSSFLSTRKGTQLNKATKPETGTKLRVSQLVLQPILLNEHDSPFTSEPVVFVGDENGTAADNLAAWIANLPLHLAIAEAQISATPNTIGASPVARPNGTG